MTGLGSAVGTPCDPTPWLRFRKNRKFMGAQDDLAVVAAGRAAAHAGLAAPLGERAGLYLAVGYIPFEQEDLDAILAGSLVDGAFSMERFSTVGYDAVNPLQTFRCLSNMPAFHVSLNLDVQGPYLVGYPGPGQFYVALEEACAALRAGRVDVALVGGVAHQTNWLVRHHFSRVEPPTDRLADAAGFLVLERGERAVVRGAKVRAWLRACMLRYRPHDPLGEPIYSPVEAGADGANGPASLPVALATAGIGEFPHVLRSRDGFVAASTWEVLP